MFEIGVIHHLSQSLLVTILNDKRIVNCQYRKTCTGEIINYAQRDFGIQVHNSQTCPFAGAKMVSNRYVSFFEIFNNRSCFCDSNVL